MLLAERYAPGNQAISREPAAPFFIVVTAKQFFDAVEQRHRQATVCEAPEAAAAKLRQPPPSLSRLSNVSKRHEVSQLGQALKHRPVTSERLPGQPERRPPVGAS